MFMYIFSFIIHSFRQLSHLTQVAQFGMRVRTLTDYSQNLIFLLFIYLCSIYILGSFSEDSFPLCAYYRNITVQFINLQSRGSFFKNSEVAFYKSITKVSSVKVSGPQQKWPKFYLGTSTSNTLPTNSIIPSTRQDTKKSKKYIPPFQRTLILTVGEIVNTEVS